MIWHAVERFGSSFFLFVSNLVLARLLSPDDFGCIGMLLVFISISDAIVDGGFGSALIQKKNLTNVDYSTVFFWNLALSCVLYITLFLVAPLIAGFYKMLLMSDILRVNGIILITNALNLVQQNILKKQIAFKKLAKINLSAVIIGTCIGILSAYLGFGVWSLVIKSLITSVVLCVIYWCCGKWMPSLVFDWKALSALFKFGSFMFLNTIVNVLYINLIALIMGKRFSSSILGYYTQALKLEDIPRLSISAIVSNVSFPALSLVQDDNEKFLRASRMSFKALMYINVPLMMLLIVIAEPLFLFLFTDKWIQSVPFFQVICVMGIIFTPYEFNQNILMSKGKSDIFFFVRIVQVIIGIILVSIGLIWGIWGFIAGFVLSAYIIYMVVCFFVKKLIGYGLLSQVKDFFPVFMASLISSFCGLSISLVICIECIMPLQIIIFSFVYILLSKIFKIRELDTYLHILKLKR